MPVSSQFKLPSLEFALGSPGGGFVLPKLENLPSLGTSPSNTAPASLSDFAKTQLNESSKNPFKIPKIFPSKDELPMDAMKNLQLTNEPQKVFIDLKSALVPVTEQKQISQVPKKEAKPEVENFTPKFIDCDVRMESAKDIRIDECCERVTLKELTSRFKNCSFKKFSVVGRIIKKKFTKTAPKIQHGYELKHQINRFAFNTPSPDDKILAHLNKNKK